MVAQISWTALGVAVLALGAPIGAYLAAARRMSGKIATSDAKDLWAESASIRADCREQLERAAKRVEILEARVDALEKLNDTLGAKNAALREEIEELKDIIAGLKVIIAAQTKLEESE